jgi:nicotinate-nucleotide adenylyltransferase
MRIGLFGGSFNPAHAAHRAVTLLAMKRLGLDRIWWIVSPGNPLKDTRDLPPLAERVAAARTLARHPRICVTDIEAQVDTRYSIDTLRLLLGRCPGVRFVWLMGVDNFLNFHRWRAWRAMFELTPIAVVDRGATKLGALAAPAAQAFRSARLAEREARLLPGRKPPAWVFLHGLKSPVSSTTLRARTRKPGG